jgi:hypothetical protein
MPGREMQRAGCDAALQVVVVVVVRHASVRLLLHPQRTALIATQNPATLGVRHSHSDGHLRLCREMIVLALSMRAAPSLAADDPQF